MNKKLLYGVFILSVLFVKCNCLSFRDLYDDSTRKEVCEKAGKYKDPKEMSSLSKYVETLGDQGEAGKNFIEGLLTTGNTEGLVDFVMELIIYLVFIVFGVIFLICKFIYTYIINLCFVFNSLVSFTLLLLLLMLCFQKECSIWSMWFYFLYCCKCFIFNCFDL